MRKRGTRGWVGTGIRLAALALLVPLSLPPLCCAAAEGDLEAPQPIATDFDTVTLELQFAPAATEGTFQASGARIVDAQPWGDPLFVRADAKGFIAHPGERHKRKQQAPGKAAATPPAAKPTTILVTLKEEGNARLGIETDAGSAEVRLKDVSFDAATKHRDGLVTVRRLPSCARLTAAAGDNDYPASACASDGSLWVAFVAYRHGGEPDMEAAKKGDFRSFTPSGNGDQICLAHFDGRQWSAPLGVTDPLLDLWKPTVAVDGAGKVWVAWSRNVGGNWDIYRRSYDPQTKQWSPVDRVTREPGADVNVVSATDVQGNVWWAWQGRREKFFQIFLTSLSQAEPIAVTNNAANHWAPAIAADSKGSVYVAWDSYENGNYDVFLQRFAAGRAEKLIAVAATSRYEARASLAVDGQDRLWIAYEEGGVNWGKDFGMVVAKSPAVRRGEGGDGLGIPLYNGRRVVVKCYCDVPRMLQQGSYDAFRLRTPADPAVAWVELQRFKSFPRLAVAANGRLWLLFRHHPLPDGKRETWAEYAMSYDGMAWSTPRRLANSDNLLDNRPALVPFGGDGVMAIYSSDCRLRGARNMEGAEAKPLKNDLYAARLRDSRMVFAPQLIGAEAAAAAVKPVHPNESQDIQRLRQWRVQQGDQSYQLARGEFHRHTEYTSHGDNDGSLEDMWRYAQDVADMDWLGNADHDNGFGYQYPWWTIQKTMDIYHNPPWFVAPYTYERSVSWPNGHRNVIFAQRGIRTLPRGDLQGDQKSGTPDTKMLYAYLEHFGGICASHTSATGMGTDWRDNHRLLEPVVEIYQGDRNNYECEGAPRSPTAQQMAANPEDSNNKIHPAGFIWNALAKGYRFGFESSSDHVSTHCSYAVALVEKPGRQQLLEAFRARRCYAATDNILLIVKCAGHLMGEEFALAGKPTLEIQAVGTAPIAKIDIVRNNRYVYSATPNAATLQTQWTDADPPAGGSNYYYVRIEQSDGNLAWSSPLWITPPR